MGVGCPVGAFLVGAWPAAQPDGFITQVLGRPVTEGGFAMGAIGFGEAVRRRWRELGPGPGVIYFLQMPYLCVLWILGLVGAVQGLRDSRMRGLILVPILGAVIFVLISGGYPGDPRYRLPALPFLIVLVTIGVSSLGRKAAAR